MSQLLALIHNPASTSSRPLSSFVTRERPFSTQPIIWKRLSDCVTESRSWTKGTSLPWGHWNNYWPCATSTVKCSALMVYKSCSSNSLEKHYATNNSRKPSVIDKKEGKHSCHLYPFVKSSSRKNNKI